MNIIQCSLDCIFQKEGYCDLNFCGYVNSVKSECPHYKPLNKPQNIGEITDADNFN